MAAVYRGAAGEGQEKVLQSLRGDRRGSVGEDG